MQGRHLIVMEGNAMQSELSVSDLALIECIDIICQYRTSSD